MYSRPPHLVDAYLAWSTHLWYDKKARERLDEIWAKLDEMMAKGTAEQIARTTQAYLPTKKFDLAKLRKAYEGK